MIEYQVQKGDTLTSLAEKLGLPNAYTLKIFHNFKGPIERGIGSEIKEGMFLTIPEPHEVDDINAKITKKTENTEKTKVEYGSENNSSSNSENSEDKNQQEKEEQKESEEKSAGEHDGKLFVIQKGKAICDKGTKFPNFKVTSHQKHYINNKEASNDFLAVTKDDTQFNPPAVSFGNCSLQNNQPCSFVPAGKWQKFYKDVQVKDHPLLTEISELQCSIGGKIKVMDHGQRAQLTKQNFKNADPKVHGYINPFVNLRKFINQLDGEDLDAY